MLTGTVVSWLPALEAWLTFPADSLWRGPSTCPAETLFSFPGLSHPQFLGGGLLPLCPTWLLIPSILPWHVVVHPSFPLLQRPFGPLKRTPGMFAHTVHANTHVFCPQTDSGRAGQPQPSNFSFIPPSELASQCLIF